MGVGLKLGLKDVWGLNGQGKGVGVINQRTHRCAGGSEKENYEQETSLAEMVVVFQRRVTNYSGPNQLSASNG